MEYNNVEKQFLELLDRTDFKHLSRNDVITYASKLNELRPEVASQVIAQYPEFVKLIQSSLSEYRAILERIIQSDDESLGRVYDTTDKELDIAAESRRLFYETARTVLDHCAKCFDAAATPEERMQIRDQEIEILRIHTAHTIIYTIYTSQSNILTYTLASRFRCSIFELLCF